MMKRLKTVIYGAAVAGLCLSQVSGVYASGLSQTTMNTFWAEGETVLETGTSESSTELESETASDPQTQESESVPETEAPESESVPETEVPESESVLQTEAPESESVPETEVPESESVPETEDPEPIKDGFVHEDGHTYYYQNGVMLKNKELYDKNNWYYFDHTGKMATGWTKHHNKQYYYDKDGRMVHGIYEIEGKKYGFDEWSGVLLTGEHLFTDKNDGYWYYFYEKDDSKHKKGEMAVGWVKHHSKQYYYDENGVMVHHIVKIDGKYYGFNEWTGVLLTGEHYLQMEALTSGIIFMMFPRTARSKARWRQAGRRITTISIIIMIKARWFMDRMKLMVSYICLMNGWERSGQAGCHTIMNGIIWIRWASSKEESSSWMATGIILMKRQGLRQIKV